MGTSFAILGLPSATPLTAVVAFCAGFLILYLFAIPGPHRIDLTGPGAPMDIRERLQRAMHSAGMFDQAPSIILVGLSVVTVLAGLLLARTLGNIFIGFILAAIFVSVGTYLYLINRQRNFMGRASDELVPFLNKMATSVGAGMPAQQAYLQAVEDSVVLRELLEDSAAKISTGERFSTALIETLPILPLRMWAVFVRQLELYEEVGGDVTGAIQSTVTQVNQMLQLQAEARADYAIQSKQQKLIIGILLGGLGAFIFVVPNGKEMTKSLVTDPVGIIGLVLGLGVIAFGLWFLNKQLRDVEKKLAF